MSKTIKIAIKKIIMPIVVFVSSVLPISAMANCERPPNLYGFDDIACPYDGFSKVEKNAKYGFVDLNGQILIPADYDDATSFSEGLAELVQNGQSFFINTQGKKVFSVDKNIDVISDFQQGLLVVKQNGKIGFMDTSGNIVIDFSFDNASDFKEDFAVIVQNGSWGFINKIGQIVITPQYTQASKFSEGLASVELDGKWGYIDKTGKIVIPLNFDYASAFKNGVAEVEMGGEWINIDKTGQPIADKTDKKRGTLQKQIDKILYKK
ncbi:WG repeat-containing protein [Faucicola mancuniensis]|uniref:WG repeat-containing protein n=1 Tax=Faucicola mancuniensis TaxID=1309795 RepID=UPI00397788BB